MSTQVRNKLIFRILPISQPPEWPPPQPTFVRFSSDAEATYTRGSQMPEIARSKEPYPLDKLTKIDTDKLLRVVTYPPEWYLKNVLSATDEAVEDLKRSCSLELGVEEEGTEGSKTESKGMEKLVEGLDLEAGVELKAAEAASQAQPATRDVTAGLESLPYELFYKICDRFTIATLWALKHSCRRLSTMVSSMKDVQFALEYAPGAVAVLLRTGAASFWTLGRLKKLMVEQQRGQRSGRVTLHLCEGCEYGGTPGLFVFLLTGQRRCWACLTQGSVFPGRRLEVRQTRGAEDGGVEGIEKVDEEQNGGREGEERPSLSKKIFIKAGPDGPFLRSPHPLEFEVEYTTKGKREGKSKGEVVIHLPSDFTNETLTKVTGSTPPLYRKPHDMTDDEFRAYSLFRYMAVALPYPFPSSPSDATLHLHSAHTSHVCWGCLLASRVTGYPADPELASHLGAWRELRMGMGHYRMLVYSRDEYLQHFRWCRLAQERWEATIKNRDLRTGEEVVPEEYETRAAGEFE